MIVGSAREVSAAEIAAWKSGKLWGATAIATFLGVSVATVYELYETGDCPIYKPGGRYFALKSELMQWAKSRAA